jgi:hypothetical protein
VEPKENAIKMENINFATVISEKKIDKKIADGTGGFLDKTDRSDSEIFKIKFADGIEGTLVFRDNTWYNYSIWGKNKENPFASKNDGLQKIWEDGHKLRRAGEALGGAVSSDNVPLKKDGTPDKRFSVNK